jgi:hypothetical protein
MDRARISQALRELAFDDRVPVAEAMDRYFAPDFEHRNSGQLRTRAEFAAMAAQAREGIAHATVTVLDEIQDGSHYAERHLLDVTRKDGGKQRAEIYIIGRYAEDGRFAALHEAGFSLLEAE